MAKTSPVTVYLPDTRGVIIGRFGIGNAKIGWGVFTYSRLAGAEEGTCPGSTPGCEVFCYAKRITAPVRDIYLVNSAHNDVPPIPPECKLLRLHVSGDFDTVEYIESWIQRLTERPDVAAWGYTRSWRVPQLLPALERLRALPNVQLFASMDSSHTDMPPAGWRRAWVYRTDDEHAEPRITPIPGVMSADMKLQYTHTCAVDGTPSYVCPEETGYKRDCIDCGYCFEGQKNDVTFLEHNGKQHTSEARR